jgi:hypothetical protein
MVKENPGLAIAENTTIDSIDFFNWVEGNKNLVVSKIELSLQI